MRKTGSNSSSWKNFLFPLFACLILASGCDTVSESFDDVFSKKRKPPLPGKRVSILLNQRSITPDPRAANEQILLPAPSVNRDWPQPGGYPNHAMHHIAVGDALKQIWRVDIGEGADEELRLVAAPIVVNGWLFTIDSEHQVTALNAESGKQIWRIDLTPKAEDDGHIGGGITFEAGRIFVATGFGVVYALNAKDGAVLWSTPVDGPMRTAPTAHGGQVFVMTLENKTIAFDSKTGKKQWTHAGTTETASVLGGGSPAVDQGVVVVGYSSGEVFALKSESGRVLWSDSLSGVRRGSGASGLSHIRGRPIIDRGNIIAMSNSGIIASFDLRTGRRIWDKRISGGENPWVAGNFIFLLTNDSEIAALSRSSGRIYWVTGLPRFEGGRTSGTPIVWTGPILASDRLLVAGSNGEALAVSPYTGKVLGKESLPDGVSVAPIVANRTVYFLSDNADLSAYR
ncbi:MAG: PQQ-binding-like beta-propeller repeat protein [Rhodospirillaceae bacterium]|jgi:outer membrane protein assembly factor BamB|nr:PQQ-binding-like beta-propeller repeat protein [Rhodospirillales bacterium]MBT3906817.1 PQQ-binding-like beta-propeller repeat protein [Rhodospirillaceae bacterium]MBT4701794.1 PQQ-binding-like beta-propeller repeat protein [Rhodospirillaceae bacterium]MBT5035819.1 PQQ-binding-like beta-propeller repeat protein [Rhodospirillaceae bacterium]MBT6221974.1 PQQ-binding-like beta-propeller repeat protein [Rhodospirillaceae bacterium]